MLKQNISLSVIVVWNGNLESTYLTKTAALQKRFNPKRRTASKLEYQLFTPLYLVQLDSVVYPSHSEGCFESYFSTVCSPMLPKVILSFQGSKFFSWQTCMCCFCLQFPYSSEQKLASLACCTCISRYIAQQLFCTLLYCLFACLNTEFCLTICTSGW